MKIGGAEKSGDRIDPVDSLQLRTHPVGQRAVVVGQYELLLCVP